jgi:hypothetical protein
MGSGKKNYRCAMFQRKVHACRAQSEENHVDKGRFLLLIDLHAGSFLLTSFGLKVQTY